MSFPGFPKEAAAFFRGLRRNNRREWFQARKEVFDDRVKRPMLELVSEINGALIRFAPDHVTEPEKALYRIYRDTRFSHDKTPYKTHIAANFPKRGLEKHSGAGYYFSVSDTEIEVAGGIYMPTPDHLLTVRRHLAANHARFRKIVAAKALRDAVGEPQGDRLTRVPKGFDPEHPAADLVKYKQLYWYVTLPGDAIATPRLYDEVLTRFRAMAPAIAFLNECAAVKKRPPAAF